MRSRSRCRRPGPYEPGQALAASSSDLKKELSDTRAQIEKIRAQIAKAEVARKAALGDIVALDQSIEESEKEVRLATAARDAAAEKLAALSEQLDQVNVDLDLKREQLGRTESDLQTQQEVFNTRVANVYRSGGRLIYLAALLEPLSVSQLVGRIDLLTAVVGQDNTILAQIKDLKAEVEGQKQALEEEAGPGGDPRAGSKCADRGVAGSCRPTAGLAGPA